jgi:hypothetical protein
MRKTLLTTGMALAALCGSNMMSAETVNFSISSATDIEGTYKETTYADDGVTVKAWANYSNLTSLSLGDFKVTTDKNTGSTAPSYYTAETESNYTLRVYADNLLTIAAPENVYITAVTLKYRSAKNVSEEYPGDTYFYDADNENALTKLAQQPVYNSETSTISWELKDKNNGLEKLVFTFPKYTVETESESGETTSKSYSPNVQITEITIEYIERTSDAEVTYTTNPANGETVAEAVTKLYVTFAEDAEPLYNEGKATLLVAGASEAIELGEPEFSWDDDPNVVYQSLGENCSSNGVYTVSFPEGYWALDESFPPTLVSPAITVTFTVEGGVTGVESVSSNSEGVSVIYGLNGVNVKAESVSGLDKGLYIVNGKKVLVRK